MLFYVAKLITGSDKIRLGILDLIDADKKCQLYDGNCRFQQPKCGGEAIFKLAHHLLCCICHK
jgi:hypothetical protein